MTPYPSGQRTLRVTVGLAVGLLAMLVWGHQARGEQGTVEVLDSPQLLEARPESKDISLAEYREIKQEYIRKNERWKPGAALTYRVREPGERDPGRWRHYDLTLDSFDETHAWVAELTQTEGKFGSRDWVARWRLMRSAEADAELGIPRILEERARVVAGVRYGMTVQEVLRLKGGHYRVVHHQESGSANVVYDDVCVWVRGWYKGRRNQGRVMQVEAVTDLMRERMQDIPYEDEKPPRGEGTPAEQPASADAAGAAAEQ